MDFSKYRSNLLDRKKHLENLSDTGKLAAQTVELDQSRVGRVSRIDALQSQAMAIATDRRREEELRKIEAALSRIICGNFGYCLQCDELISEERLGTDPAISLCIECAGSLESG